MRPSAKRLWFVVMSLAFFIGAITIFNLLVVPEYREVQELKGERNALAKVVLEEGQLVATANRLLSEYQSAAELRNNLSLILPNEEGMAEIINQLQGLAQANAISIEGANIEILPLEPENAGSVIEPAGTFRINLRLRGGYEGLKLYAESLETNIRVIDIDSFAISEGGTKGPYRANAVIRVYYQR